MVDQQPQNPTDKTCFDYETYHEGENKILKISLEKCSFPPSIEYSDICMSKIIDLLLQNTGITIIILTQYREYEYDYPQVKHLTQLAQVYKKINKDERTQYTHLIANPEHERYLKSNYAQFQSLISKSLKQDPLACYIELKRLERREKTVNENLIDHNHRQSQQLFLTMLEQTIKTIEQLPLIALLLPHTKEYTLHDRTIYNNIFHPTTRPDFMYTKLITAYPENSNLQENYEFTAGNDTSQVNIFTFDDNIKIIYHLTPPEFTFEEELYELLDDAKRIMAEHKPSKEEFVDPERMREVFFNIGKDLINDLILHRNFNITEEKVEQLAQALLRYTVGFGLIELLLADPKVQDVNINSPNGPLPIFIVHQDYGDCYTNIYPTRLEVESWATKLRLISGRPFDEANPILDTELKVTGFSSRVAAITAPLNPSGLAFSFRRHRDYPWTFPLYMQPKIKMFSPLCAGLLSFLIDNNATILIAGTRSSGKSSLLGSFLVEIMRKIRLITIEDTFELPQESLRALGYNIESLKVASALSSPGSEVDASIGIRSTLRLGDSAILVGEVRSSLRGNEEVVVVENGLTKRVAIQSLENKPLHSFFVPTLDAEQKMKLQKLTGFVKHPMRSQLLKIITKSGREVTVTPDHSVFTNVNFKIAAINSDQLKIGDPIIIPAKIPCGFNDVNHINLLEVFKDNYRLEGAEPYIRKAIAKVGWRKATKICEISDIYMYLRPKGQLSRIPISHFLKLVSETEIEYNIEDLRIKRGTSLSIPAKFPINENILRLVGYYLAEGNLDGKKIQITNSKPKIIEDIEEICRKEFGFNIYKRRVFGLGTSIQMHITCKPLADLFEYWGCGKTSLHKRIPEFVFGLTERKICALLQGMYSGDGSFSSGQKMGNLIRYFSTSKSLVEDVGYGLLSIGIVCRFHNRDLKSGKKFYTAEIKQRKYAEIFLTKIGFTHKKPELSTKSFAHTEDDSVLFEPKELDRHLILPRKYRHLRKTKCCSKNYLKKITEEVKCSNEIYDFAHGDFFIDKVKSVEILNLSKPEYVYDLSVKSTERFIGGFGGILLHNTEAKALFEAMRVGAAANVVAGTIHADSPYGVYDRVVNDIGVPKTSFKAIDIIVIVNPVISGLKRFKRILRITEIRKEWDDDPLKENAFVDLMVYNPKTDQLEITDDLINGNSEIIKRMASRIKEFAGDWDAIWQNIQLRADVKQAIVDQFIKTNDPDILEAEFVIKANDIFHIISDKIKERTGKLDNNSILFEYKDWLNKEVKKRKM